MLPVSHFHPRQLPSASRFSYLRPKMRPLPVRLNPTHNLVTDRIPHTLDPCVPAPPIYTIQLQSRSKLSPVLAFAAQNRCQVCSRVPDHPPTHLSTTSPSPTTYPTSRFHPGAISSTYAQDQEWWSKPLGPSSCGTQLSNSRTSLIQYVSPTSTDPRFRLGAIPNPCARDRAWGLKIACARSSSPASVLIPAITILSSPNIFHPPPPIFVATALQYRVR